jgi:excisionase family DNA binding protein
MYDDTTYAARPAAAGMSVEEAARFLGLGRSLIFNEIKSGRLIARKAGRRTIVARDDALAYLRSLPVAGTAA